MQPKIIFLGTGGDSFVVGKQIRGSGGLIIQSNGRQIHIDPGPGAVVKACVNGINLRENTAVLVSNNSIINCSDINAVIDAMSIGGIDVTGVLLAPPSLINGDENSNPYLTKTHKNYVERVLAVKPGQRIGIEDIEIQVLNTTQPGNVGYKLFTPDFVLSYASDTGFSKEIAEQYAMSDILILNVPNASENDENRLNCFDAAKIVSQVMPRLTILTHFGKRMIESDPLYEAREIQKATGYQVIAAYDSMVVSPTTYSANMRQKTLNLYSAKKPTVVEERQPITLREIDPGEPDDERKNPADDKQQTL